MPALRPQSCAKLQGGGSGRFPQKHPRTAMETSSPEKGISRIFPSEGTDKRTIGSSMSASDETVLLGRCCGQQETSTAKVSEATEVRTKMKTETTRASGRETNQAFQAAGQPPQLQDNLEEASPSLFGSPSKPKVRPFSLWRSTHARLRVQETQGSPYREKRVLLCVCTTCEFDERQSTSRNSAIRTEVLLLFWCS